MLLELNSLTKKFGGLVAVDNINFTVFTGQIKALIGPNGAGKTTVFNLITGFYRPSLGEILLKQDNIAKLSPHKISALGISRTFQNTQLFEDMTLLENVMVGCHTKTKTEMFSAALRLPRFKLEEKFVYNQSMHFLNIVELQSKHSEKACNLPQGERRLLEIARALASEPELLLLDEPAAGLNNSETENLAKTIYRIRDLGTTILLVEHDMGLVMEVSDEVVVLNYGEKIAEGPPLLIQKDEKVIEAYLGRDINRA